MGNIQYWQLATDGLLVLALFFLAIRFTRSSSSSLQGRSQDLERGLKALVKEAEKAGRILNDTLAKRQHELQDLLSELQAAEGRFSNFDGRASDASAQLDSKLDAAREVIKGIENTLSALETQASTLSAVAENPLATRSVLATSPQPQQEVSRASGSSPLTAAVERTTYDPTPEPASFRKPSPTPAQPGTRTLSQGGERRGVNIYGEPIQSESAPTPRQPVNQSRGAYQSPQEPSAPKQNAQPAEQAAAASMKQVYAAAEKLLRAGYDLQTVSVQTRLSMDEVRMLSQVVAEERKESSSAARSRAAYAQRPAMQAESERQSPVFAPNEIQTVREDDRLGVLGSMKRERYTV